MREKLLYFKLLVYI